MIGPMIPTPVMMALSFGRALGVTGLGVHSRLRVVMVLCLLMSLVTEMLTCVWELVLTLRLGMTRYLLLAEAYGKFETTFLGTLHDLLDGTFVEI